MKRVIIESPYAGDVARNTRYLRACMRNCLKRGEAPFASHGLYTQPGVLDDTNAEEREHGIQAGFAWRDVAETTVMYMDLGVSKGMDYGFQDAEKKDRAIEFRRLGADWDTGPPSELATVVLDLIEALHKTGYMSPDIQNTCLRALRLAKETP